MIGERRVDIYAFWAERGAATKEVRVGCDWLLRLFVGYSL